MGQCLGRGRNMGSRILGTALRWFAGDRRGGSCHCRGQEAVPGRWCHGSGPDEHGLLHVTLPIPPLTEAPAEGSGEGCPSLCAPTAAFHLHLCLRYWALGNARGSAKLCTGREGSAKAVSAALQKCACPGTNQPPCWPGSLPIIPLAKRLRCGGALGFRAEMPPSPFSWCALDWEVQQGDAAGDIQGGTSLS